MRSILHQLDQFSRDGFIAFDEFLEPRAATEMIGAVENLPLDEQATRVRGGSPYARRNLLNLDFVRSLIATPRVHELVAAVAADFVAVRAILFDKTASANWSVPWHQDRSIAVDRRVDLPGFGPWSRKAGVVHVQPPLEILKSMFTLRIHLDACGLDNAPLRLIAATHDRLLNPDEIERFPSGRPQQSCTVSAGGAVLMRPLILHASSPAKVASHRRVIHIEFGPPSLPGGLNWALV